MCTMGANGSSVFDAITNGWKRGVLDHGNSFVVSLPADFVDEYDVQPGDDVAIREGDGEETVLELHFGGQE